MLVEVFARAAAAMALAMRNAHHRDGPGAPVSQHRAARRNRR